MGQRERRIAGVMTEVFLFLMRACFSGACFVAAFERENQQAFLEAHVAAFEFFGGCFVTCRYDNLSSAVKTVLKGRRRVETDRFVALRSHTCTNRSSLGLGFGRAGEGRGRGRGGQVSPLASGARPEVASLAELNERIAAGCIRDLDRTIRGRRVTVGEALTRRSTC